jgi:hypothetical protein
MDSASDELLELDSLEVGKAGLPPLVECHSAKRGQARLPNHELLPLNRSLKLYADSGADLRYCS